MEGIGAGDSRPAAGGVVIVAVGDAVEKINLFGGGALILHEEGD